MCEEPLHDESADGSDCRWEPIGKRIHDSGVDGDRDDGSFFYIQALLQFSCIDNICEFGVTFVQQAYSLNMTLGGEYGFDSL